MNPLRPDDTENDEKEDADDPAELTPMDEKVFATEINKMVAGDAPRLFALCEPIGDRADAGTVAWGADFDHSAVLFRSNGKLHETFSSADNALRMFSHTRHFRLI